MVLGDCAFAILADRQQCEARQRRALRSRLIIECQILTVKQNIYSYLHNDSPETMTQSDSKQHYFHHGEIPRFRRIGIYSLQTTK